MTFRRLSCRISFIFLLLAAAAVRADDALHLERFRGKVVLVDFWASWCEPCRHSFPWLNAMQSKYGDRGLVVIAVNVDRERGEAERFLRETPAQFDIIFDPQGTLAARYDVPGMPVSYVFGPDGDLLRQHIGFRDAARAEREAEIESLLRSTDLTTPEITHP